MSLTEKSGPIQPLKRLANKKIIPEDKDRLRAAFAEWMIEQGQLHRDKRETLAAFAARWSIKREMLAALKKDPAVVEIIRQRMPDMIAMHAPELYPAMAKYALAGNPAMMKLALQQARLLEAEKTESKNLHVVLDASQIPRPSIDESHNV